MLPSWLNVGVPIPHNTPVLVIDAGGTNFRVSKVFFTGRGECITDNSLICKMPGTNGAIDAESFFNICADYIQPMLQGIDRIGFCFSYPSRITPALDAQLLRWTKEVEVTGLENILIGKRLSETVQQRFKKKVQVIMLNDSSAVLLGGRAAAEKNYSAYIGFILGTGTNCAYGEYNRCIAKAHQYNPEIIQCVNTESANFNKLSRGTFDISFDNTTVCPESHVLEKMISGGYLGGLAQHILHNACSEGIFSTECASVLSRGIIHTSHLDPLLIAGENSSAQYPPSHAAHTEIFTQLPPEDYTGVAHIAGFLRDRAALLAAVIIASAVIKSGQGINPERPVCITADGSTFYKMPGMKQHIEKNLHTLLDGIYKRYYEIVKIDDCPVKGAAVAGLTGQPYS